jgi:tellurite resistance protein
MADSDSSPESTPPVDGSVQTEAPAITAPEAASVDSAATEKDGEPKSMVEAVKSALKPADTDEAPPPSSPDQDPTKADPASEKTAEQAAPDELTEVERSQLKGRTKRSFERLTSRVSELGTQNEALQSRVAEYDRVVDYIRSTKLKADEIDTVFDIATTMKSGNPHEALRKLVPIVQQLQRQAGVVLPDDLTQQVSQGYLTEQHARELAMARSEAAHARAREEFSAQERQQVEQQAQHKAHLVSLQTAADEWERQKAGKDLDWSRKSARVHELAKLEVLQHGPPKSAQLAVEMFNNIYDRVTADLKALMPKPSAVRPLNGGASSTRSVAEPKSMLDAIRMSTRGSA